MGLSITILQPANLTATVDGGSILAAVVGSSATLNIEMGVPGPGATVQVGTTTTGDAGTDASVVNAGTVSAAILDFTIPRGDKGEQGNQGPKGDTGEQGPKGDKGDTGATGAGVAVGGTAGQVLAKIDSTNYNTHWVDQNASGVWGQITGTLSNQTDLQSALDGKLSLSGGTMSAGALIDFTVTSGNDSEIGAWGFGVENTSGQVSYIEPQEIRIYDGTSTTGTRLIASGVQFNDGSTQVTSGLPLTGGTMSLDAGITFGQYAVEGVNWLLINKDGIRNEYNGGTNSFTLNGNLLRIYDDGDYRQGTTITSSAITFNDLTVQSTAGLPLTGGTMSGDINLNSNLYVNTNPSFDLLWISNEFISFQADLVRLDSNGISLTGGSGFITFADYSTQATAFIPANYLTASNIASTYLTQSNASSTYYAKPTGTTSQYIRGDGSLYTFPQVGDRYLTSSTTSLTISNGAKTLTIGTGLSYSTQQDVTIAYDASNHMHATVTSYDSTTGIMVCDVYNKSGSGTYTVWTVNVGGVVGGSYLQTANNLSELTATASTARTNLGLGSMATQSTSAYLSSSAIASTYQTQSGMSAYLSTSAASSTYLTQSNASSTYLTQANASTTYIGTSAYATTAQAEAMTSTSTVVSPARFRDAYFTANVSKPQISTWLIATTGTGGLNDGGNGDYRRLQGPTSAANTIVRASHLTNFTRGGDYNKNIDWSKYNALYFRLRTSGADTNSTFIITLGEDSNGAGNADPTVRCVGIKFNYGGVVKILAHNGTTLVQPSTSYTPANNTGIDFLIVSDGSGTVEVFANGTSIGTTTGGPTTLLAGTAQQQCINARVFNNSTPSGGQLSIYIGGVTAYTS